MKLRCLASLLLAPALLSAPALAQDTANDFWSDRITWRAPDGWYAVGIHASLLPDGRLHFIGYERETEDAVVPSATRRSSWVMTPTPLGEPLPSEVTVENVSEPVEIEAAIFGNVFVADDLFCAGNSITADGRVFTVGGTRGYIDLTTFESAATGLSYATLFDGFTWERVPEPMTAMGPLGLAVRWYPSAMRLADGRMLVASGYEMVSPSPTPNLSVETFDPRTETWELLSSSVETPGAIFNGDYTHPVLLPRSQGFFDVLMFGQDGIPVFFSTTSAIKWALGAPRPGTLAGEIPNNGASTTLLPIRLRDGEWGYGNGSTLVTGGAFDTSHMAMVDVYDPESIGWTPRKNTGVMRHHPATVLLPDGKVLRVAGDALTYDPNIERAGYVDPRNGFAHALGASQMGYVRGYHTVSLLLPDGRVLVGGGRGLDTVSEGEKSHFQYLYPPYMFKPRPALLYAPGRLSYGKSFPIITQGRKIREVVLIGLGSMTHSMDFNQRHVQLKIARAQVPLEGNPRFRWVEAPKDAQTAPPGPYMLFALDAARRPSQAMIVELR